MEERAQTSFEYLLSTGFSVILVLLAFTFLMGFLILADELSNRISTYRNAIIISILGG